MRAAFSKTLTARVAQLREMHLSRADLLRWAALGSIVTLAAALRFANLGALGYANHYYAAAVKSMLLSWHNLFFVAAEPGGSVSVDKPPVGLWLQAISASVFGVNGFAVLLPQILAGIASVVVLYHLVRRWFGATAGLLAALALAVTPIAVATDRNNTMDSTLILTLLLAAWAFIKATESQQLRYLLLGAALVGLGFNIKMLQAYLPLPAFYGLYLLGARESLWRKASKLALASGLLLAVSLSWALAVDLTPAEQRPYVGSSSDNSVLSLITGYNGMQRLLGMGNPGGLAGLLGDGAGGEPSATAPRQRDDGPNASWPPPAPGANGAPAQPGPNGDSAALPAISGGDGFFTRVRPGHGGPGGPMDGGRGGFPGTGRAGLQRLFTTPLSKEVSWLLPLALLSTVLLAFRSRLRIRTIPLSLHRERAGVTVDARFQAAVLWGGWLLVGAAFFSVAGFYHEYYLSMLAPPVAALVGTGAVELWRLAGQPRALAATMLLVAAGATLALQLGTAGTYVGLAWYLPASVALLAAGGALAIAEALVPQRAVRLAGYALAIAALLVIPGIWSGLTVLNSNENQALPCAYSGHASGLEDDGSLRVNQTLIDYLQVHTQGATYLMAVPSAMHGADYVLATNRPVLYIGGFMGQDPVLTTEQLAQLVREGKLKYILWNDRAGGMHNQPDLSAWIASHSILIPGFEIQAHNAGGRAGSPMGARNTKVQDGGGAFWGGGMMQLALYELSP
ncbi:MAG: glycosyltransferase family 39 protein [Anaerolineae bacterium]